MTSVVKIQSNSNPIIILKKFHVHILNISRNLTILNGFSPGDTVRKTDEGSNNLHPVCSLKANKQHMILNSLIHH